MKLLSDISLTLFHLHQYTGNQPVFIISSPRSGSTWLMELLLTQPGMYSANEPFNLRNAYHRKMLGINTWEELYNKPRMKKLLHILIT